MVDLGSAFPQEVYQTAAVTAITGVKRPRLQTWLERGWIQPSIQSGSGAGTRNIFSRNDLYIIGIFKLLTETGIPRETVGDIIAELKGDIGFPLVDMEKEGYDIVKHTLFYCTKGENSRAILLSGSDFLFGDTILSLGMNGYEYAFIFNILPVITEIDKKIEAMK